MYNEEELQKAQYLSSQGIGSAMSLRKVTFREQIANDLKHLEELVVKKKEMLKLLDENPAIEKFMDLSLVNNYELESNQQQPTTTSRRIHNACS